MDELLRYWPIVATVLIPAGIWAVRMGLASKDDLRAAEARIAAVEVALEHVPDADQIQELALAVSDMRGDIKTLASQVGTAAAVSERLQTWLLEHGK